MALPSCDHSGWKIDSVAPPAAIDDAIRKAPLGLARERGRRQPLRMAGPGALAVETPIAEIGEDDDATRHPPGTAAVFMHARTRAVGLRGHLRDIAPSPIGADDDQTALLLRPPLQPIDVIAIDPHLRQAHGMR